MGITISNSDANEQVKMIKEYKKQKRLEMIGSEGHKPTHDRFDVIAMKENHRQSKSANVSPVRNNTRNYIQKDENANNISSQGQKKVNINGSRTPEQLTKLTSKELQSTDIRKNTDEKWFAEIQNNANQRMTNSGKQAHANSHKMRESNQREIPIQQQKIGDSLIREIQPVSMKHSQINKSWKGPLGEEPSPAQRPAQRDEFNIEMKRASFGHYDWNIPSDQQQKDFFRRKGMMPSMNLVLSNKFAQNPNNLSEHDSKIAAKNRRQMMRQLLSGKRNNTDENFKLLPSCNFQRLQFPKLCKNS